MGRRCDVPVRVLETLEALRDQVREEILKDPRYLTFLALERSIHDIRSALQGAATSAAQIAPPDVELASIIDGRLAEQGQAAVGASGLSLHEPVVDASASSQPHHGNGSASLGAAAKPNGDGHGVLHAHHDVPDADQAPASAPIEEIAAAVRAMSDLAAPETNSSAADAASSSATNGHAAEGQDGHSALAAAVAEGLADLRDNESALILVVEPAEESTAADAEKPAASFAYSASAPEGEASAGQALAAAVAEGLADLQNDETVILVVEPQEEPAATTQEAGAVAEGSADNETTLILMVEPEQSATATEAEGSTASFGSSAPSVAEETPSVEQESLAVAVAQGLADFNDNESTVILMVEPAEEAPAPTREAEAAAESFDHAAPSAVAESVAEPDAAPASAAAEGPGDEQTVVLLVESPGQPAPEAQESAAISQPVDQGLAASPEGERAGEEMVLAAATLDGGAGLEADETGVAAEAAEPAPAVEQAVGPDPMSGSAGESVTEQAVAAAADVSLVVDQVDQSAAAGMADDMAVSEGGDAADTASSGEVLVAASTSFASADQDNLAAEEPVAEPVASEASEPVGEPLGVAAAAAEGEPSPAAEAITVAAGHEPVAMVEPETPAAAETAAAPEQAGDVSVAEPAGSVEPGIADAASAVENQAQALASVEPAVPADSGHVASHTAAVDQPAGLAEAPAELAEPFVAIGAAAAAEPAMLVEPAVWSEAPEAPWHAEPQHASTEPAAPSPIGEISGGTPEVPAVASEPAPAGDGAIVSESGMAQPAAPVASDAAPEIPDAAQAAEPVAAIEAAPAVEIVETSHGTVSDLPATAVEHAVPTETGIAATGDGSQAAPVQEPAAPADSEAMANLQHALVDLINGDQHHEAASHGDVAAAAPAASGEAGPMIGEAAPPGPFVHPAPPEPPPGPAHPG